MLVEEREPALYGYAQRYTVPGTTEVRERRGLICLGHLYDYAEQVVYRHEQTLAKPKSDRLSLFKATRTYCEQIYMLYSDPAFTVEKLVFGNSSGEPTTPADETVTDEYGVVHSVWKVTDPHVLNLLVGALADKKLIIADGHHRYETSTAYARERAAELGVPDTTKKRQDRAHGGRRGRITLKRRRHDRRSAAARRPLSGSRDDDDAGQHRRAGHHHPADAPHRLRAEEVLVRSVSGSRIRVLRHVEGRIGSRRSRRLRRGERRNRRERTAPLNGTEGVAFLAVMRDGTFLLQAKKDAVEGALQHVPPRQRALDVVQLHALVLEQLLDLTPESIRQQENLRYLRSAEDAAAQVARGEADIAFLIKPVTLDQMKEVSLSGEVMPQKSTDFYPKLLSGLAFYALD